MKREACAWPGCPNHAEKRSAWCRTHLWRRQHDKPMGDPIRPRGTNPRQRVREAALGYAEAEDEEKAWHRLRVAAERWFRARGWKPPPRHP